MVCIRICIRMFCIRYGMYSNAVYSLWYSLWHSLWYLFAMYSLWCVFACCVFAIFACFVFALYAHATYFAMCVCACFVIAMYDVCPHDCSRIGFGSRCTGLGHRGASHLRTQRPIEVFVEWLARNHVLGPLRWHVLWATLPSLGVWRHCCSRLRLGAERVGRAECGGGFAGCEAAPLRPGLGIVGPGVAGLGDDRGRRLGKWRQWLVRLGSVPQCLRSLGQCRRRPSSHAAFGLSELVVAVVIAVAAFRPSFLACPSGLLR